MYNKIKKITWIILICLFPVSAFSQVKEHLNGSWEGSLETPQGTLRIVLHLDIESKDSWEASIDSPDQGVTGINVSYLRYSEDSITVKSGKIMAVYKAGINQKDSVLKGKWSQGFSQLDLNLKKTVKPAGLNRPQEPEPPFPYEVKEVKFNNKVDNIDLAGTLTLPEGKGPFSSVVLISGSGPQDRNEELMGHKPFLLLADYLTRNGIAVLRYDDRGVGGSKGDFQKANTHDFSKDAEAAFDFLKKQEKINPDKTGLLGHSEGGMIAPMVASRNDDVGFIILLAGVGVPGDSLLLMQQKALLSEGGVSDSTIWENERASLELFRVMKADIPSDSLKNKMEDILLSMDDKAKKELGINKSTISPRVNQMSMPWYLSFVRFKPAPFLREVTCPVLAINGTKDLQVPSKENLQAIERHLKNGGNDNITTKEFTDLNHLFQEAETGLPSEYGSIEQTISPEVLEYVTNWIKER